MKTLILHYLAPAANTMALATVIGALVGIEHLYLSAAMLAASMAMLSSLLTHGNVKSPPCARCMATFPLNPSEAAERRLPALHAFHLLFDRPRRTIQWGMFGFGVVTAVAANIWPRAVFFAFAMVCMAVAAMAVHHRFAPWCPWCRNGGDDTPTQLPAPTGPAAAH